MTGVGVAFKAAGPILHCNAGSLAFALGDEVVVEEENGPRIGRVVVPAAPLTGAAALPRVLRLATTSASDSCCSASHLHACARVAFGHVKHLVAMHQHIAGQVAPLC